MSKIWSLLGKARLQELIGPQLLEKLLALLPAVVDGLDESRIYSTEGLSSILDAFSASTLMGSKDFREEVFNALPRSQMARMLSALSKAFSEADWAKNVKVLRDAWNDPKQAAIVAGELGIGSDFLPQEGRNIPSCIGAGPATRAYKPLLDYQQEVFASAEAKISTPLARFVMQLPTGAGKTRTAMEAITSLLNRQSEGTVVLWLAHSEELCEQAYDCFLEVWEHVARKCVQLIRAWGGDSEESFEFEGSAFIVGGFAKLYSLMQDGNEGLKAVRDRIYLIVVDEAHRAIAPSYSHVIKGLRGPATRIMGLTATPGRSAGNEMENKLLADFFFDQIIRIGERNVDVLTMLRKRGVLSIADYVPLRTATTRRLNAADKRYLETFFDLPAHILGELADDQIRNLEIVKRLEIECREGRRILFFACSVEHSRFICAVLNYLGLKAVHIDGTTNAARRQSLIANYRSGAVQVLCNYSLLSTGFDAPITDVVFISRPTGSLVLYSQMIGRGLRGPSVGGTDRCRIIDVIDNIEGFSDASRAYHFFDGYFEPSG